MSTEKFLRGALALVALAGCVRSVATADDCRVDRITDGDTFYCRDGRKVRLIGVDTPELASHRRRCGGSCRGEAACVSSSTSRRGTATAALSPTCGPERSW